MRRVHHSDNAPRGAQSARRPAKRTMSNRALTRERLLLFLPAMLLLALVVALPIARILVLSLSNAEAVGGASWAGFD